MVSLENVLNKYFPVWLQWVGVSLFMPSTNLPVCVIITRLCLQWWDRNVLDV